MCKTLLNVTSISTHMLQDLVDIRIMLMRDNKWLLYTLHTYMKYTKKKKKKYTERQGNALV